MLDNANGARKLAFATDPMIELLLEHFQMSIERLGALERCSSFLRRHGRIPDGLSPAPDHGFPNHFLHFHHPLDVCA